MTKKQVVVMVKANNGNSSSSRGRNANSVQYGECQKNHAAYSGGYAVDGCREFMASSGEVLTCAACGCHRNFHKRELQSAD